MFHRSSGSLNNPVHPGPVGLVIHWYYRWRRHQSKLPDAAEALQLLARLLKCQTEMFCSIVRVLFVSYAKPANIVNSVRISFQTSRPQ